jgi:hypothetical protein
MRDENIKRRAQESMQTLGDRIRQTLGRVFGSDHQDGARDGDGVRAAKEDVERRANEGEQRGEGFFEKLGGTAEQKLGEAERKIGEGVDKGRESIERRGQELEQQHRH